MIQEDAAQSQRINMGGTAGCIRFWMGEQKSLGNINGNGLDKAMNFEKMTENKPSRR
ncbi:MAG: hypothetical protein ACKO85_11660 [Isosphaeraceae bacterium]